MTSTVTFPSQKDHGTGYLHGSSASLFSRSSFISLSYLKTTALEVHNLFYGTLEDLDLEGSEQRTHPPPDSFLRTSTKHLVDLYEPNAGGYENPWLTTSNRDVLTNMRALGHKLNKLHLRPFAYLLGTNTARFSGAVKVWSDVVEVCENENFDGNRTSVVDHVVHVLFLPGFHKMNARSRERGPATASLDSLTSHHGPTAHPTIAILPSIFGASPLHLELRVLSRLSFNESGRVAHHRDFVDVKELFSLIPGFTTIQWMASRASAQWLSWVSSIMGHGPSTVEHEESPTEDEFLYTMRRSTTLDTIREMQRARAPDVDRG